MTTLSKSKLITILVHFLIWSVFGIGIFFYLPIFSGVDIHYSFWTRQVFTFSLLVIAFYVNTFFLVPRIFLKNHPLYYIALVIGIVIAIVILDGWSDQLLNLQRFFDEAYLNRMMKQILAHRGDNILQLFTLIMSVLVLGISTSLAVVRKWQRDKRRREELEREKITSELSFLKAQINPHFFFNTMNNIYALTQVDADMAGQAIHKLSRIMRYLLYETPQGHALLSQEISFVKDYITLNQLRVTKAVTINANIPNQVEDMPIASMMLLPFLENAFKHGVSANQKSNIDIVILQRNKELDITISNSVFKDANASLDTSSGIGLMNTRRRLDLLYAGKYSLETCKFDN
ncbi:MAG: hypothetical protein EOO85_17155, partial [Pedobacter sp.]